MAKQNLWIQNRWALGDTVVVTAVVRDLYRQYGDRYNLHLCTNFTPVWRHNPYVASVTKWTSDPKVHQHLSPIPQVVDLQYRDGIRHAGRHGTEPERYDACHFLWWFYRELERRTGIKVKCTRAAGDIHLTPDERVPLVKGRYWMVQSGGKLDVTNKYWPTSYWQETVDMLAGLGIRCVQAGATHGDHHHPPLHNVLNLVGKTDDPRDYFGLIYNAQGVICGCTAAMHLAAAFSKPCVVLLGGREEPWWEGYSAFAQYQQFGPDCTSFPTPHRVLHTIGMSGFPCCERKGCWRARTIPLPPLKASNRRNRKTCVLPETVAGQPIARCMTVIKPQHVVSAVLSYFVDGTLA